MRKLALLVLLLFVLPVRGQHRPVPVHNTVHTVNRAGSFTRPSTRPSTGIRPNTFARPSIYNYRPATLALARPAVHNFVSPNTFARSASFQSRVNTGRGFSGQTFFPGSCRNNGFSVLPSISGLPSGPGIPVGGYYPSDFGYGGYGGFGYGGYGGYGYGLPYGFGYHGYNPYLAIIQRQQEQQLFLQQQLQTDFLAQMYTTGYGMYPGHGPVYYGDYGY